MKERAREMQAMVCELCGSNDIAKQDGFFVCQHCGTKYSLEEAKKLLGTVKIDNAEELNNLYELARRARNDNNSENAQKYYEQILVKNPSDWEANFYSVFFQSFNCKIAEIQSAAVRMTSSENTVLSLLKKQVTDPTILDEKLTEITEMLCTLANALYRGAKSHFQGIPSSIIEQYRPEFLSNARACRNIVYHYGDLIIEEFGEEYAKLHSCPSWNIGQQICKDTIKFDSLKNKSTNENEVTAYRNKILQYDPSASLGNEKEKNGCYIATAVYGSYDCPEVWTLRRYRDYTLAETVLGRLFIALYYAVSPTLVRWFGKTQWFRNMWKPKLDKMVERLNREGVADTPYQDRQW